MAGAAIVPARYRAALQALVRAAFSRTGLSVLAGAALAAGLRFLSDMLLVSRRAKAESLWRRKVDLSVVQACILTTEHLQTLGRVEKRTLFVKPITEVFRNEFILARLLETAEKAAANQESMLVTQLSEEDKWHVLNTCTNHVSALFAPYHVFFNEARRVESVYKSAWYCFTLTCTQTAAAGRWFITPNRPVGVADIGMLRIRIVMMNEQELREIAAGAIEPPSVGFFNGRHESRWRVCQRFAELFGRQVEKVTGSSDIDADWGANLCGRLAARRKSSNNLRHLPASAVCDPHHAAATSMTSPEPQHHQAEDNAILRIHIPFPATHHAHDGGANEARRHEECVAKDVVIYE